MFFSKEQIIKIALYFNYKLGQNKLEDYIDGKSHRDKIEVLQQTMPHVEYSKL